MSVAGVGPETSPAAPRVEKPGARAKPARRRRNRVWAFSALIVIGLAAGAMALVEVAATEAVPGVPMFQVREGRFLHTVRADGYLEAVQATPVAPPARVRGPLRIAWLAPDGSRVQAGDVVVRFDPSDLEKKLLDGRSERDTADSRIRQKQSREEGAIKNLERDAEMAELELEHTAAFQSKDTDIFSRVEIIESEIDETLATERKDHAEDIRGIRESLTEVELDLLGIQRRKAELQIDQAETELKELELEAPHDGIFVLKEFWGQMPKVGMMVWAGNSVGEIPQLDEMQAKVYVLEADAGGLEPGVEASVRLEAYPDQVYKAKVKQVDALAMPRERGVPVQYFGVVLELAGTDVERMKPGQRLRAELMLGDESGVIAIPRQAVFLEDGKSFVHLRSGDGFEKREITLGATGLGRVVVASGLSAGDEIALRDPAATDRQTQDEPASVLAAGGVS